MTPVIIGRALRCLRLHFLLSSAACAYLMLGAVSLTVAQDAVPLHQRIDQLVAKVHLGPVSPVAGDADFVRRIYLDLTGAVPTAAETKEFLNDADILKRPKLIDRLLADPRHARHMTQVFDVMLMERRPEKHVPIAEWRKYLFDSFMANKPYDVLVKEILSSDGTDPATRAAAKFVLDREVEPNLMTRDLGRIFFGQDLQCAQCHDHPLVDDYHQADYYGLYAFFSRSQIFTQPDKKVVLMDNLEGEVGFVSVFDKSAIGNSLPKVIGGKELPEPRLPPGQEWITAPAKDVRHVPKYSRRAQLAAQVTAPDNKPFARNIANRLWAQMLGRGIVEPVDFHHVGNPPTNPELLDALTTAIVEMKFDIRAFLREIALSDTYQRAMELPSELPQQIAEAQTRAAALAQEIAALTETQKSATDAYQTLLAEANAARRGLPPLVEEVTKAKAAAAAIQKAIDAANKVVADTTAQLAAKKDIEKSLTEATAKAKEAAAKLAMDKELAEIVAKLEAKAAPVVAEAAAIAKQVEEKTALVKVEADKMPPAQAVIDAASTKLEAARVVLIAIEEREVAAEEQRRAAEFAVSQRQLAATELESLTAYSAAAQAAEAAESEFSAALQQVAATQSEQQKQMAEMGQLQIAHENAKKSHADAQQAMQDAAKLIEAKTSAVKLIEQVKAAADAALQAIPGDPELTKVAASLVASSAAAAQDLAKANEALAARQAAMAAAQTQVQQAQENVTNAVNRAGALAQEVVAKQAAAAAITEKVKVATEAAQVAANKLEDQFSGGFASRPLRHLTPEQMGWSILRTTGVYDAYWAQTTAEIEKATPLSEEDKKDPAKLAARNLQIEQAVYDKLAPSVGTFIAFYGAGAGQPQSDFFATVDQALFLANGGAVKSWLAPGGENLTGRLTKLTDPAALSEELYLSVLSRMPTPEETTDVAAYLTARADQRPAAIQELAWSLITSAEYRFNH
jgi:hypothetical protein